MHELPIGKDGAIEIVSLSEVEPRSRAHPTQGING